jgi:hypothetical protein
MSEEQLSATQIEYVQETFVIGDVNDQFKM